MQPYGKVNFESCPREGGLGQAAAIAAFVQFSTSFHLSCLCTKTLHMVLHRLSCWKLSMLRDKFLGCYCLKYVEFLASDHLKHNFGVILWIFV